MWSCSVILGRLEESLKKRWRRSEKKGITFDLVLVIWGRIHSFDLQNFDYIAVPTLLKF